jgi:hypothetical protein
MAPVSGGEERCGLTESTFSTKHDVTLVMHEQLFFSHPDLEFSRHIRVS